MSEILKKYNKLFEDYFKKIIDESEFCRKFNEYFNSDESIMPAEFDIMEELLGYVEFFEPDIKKRNDYNALIGEDELKKAIEEAYKKLNNLFRKE